MGFGTPNRIITIGLNTNEVTLYYASNQQVELPVSEDYKTAREQIFGEGGFLKDKPAIKSSELTVGKKRIKYYIAEEEIFWDTLIEIFPKNTRDFMMFPLKDCLIARITNYFQAISGVRDENPLDIWKDINITIYRYIQNCREKNKNAYLEINFINNKYTVSLSVLKCKET